jgi:periplasmic divalent cation tolerance protein
MSSSPAAPDPVPQGLPTALRAARAVAGSLAGVSPDADTDGLDAVVEVHTSCGHDDEATTLASLAVEAGLCAAAHVWPIRSVYRWQGEVHSGVEYRVTFKTVAEAVDGLWALVEAEHSYELPAFFVTPVIGGSPEYLEWMRSGGVASD